MRRVISFVALILLTAVTISPAREAPGTVLWHGHATFSITLHNGKIVVIDPYSKKVGYDLPSLYADILLVTHEHHDHNFTKFVEGDPEILRGLTEDGKDFNEILYDKDDVLIYSVQSYHDKVKGEKRGKNAIFVIVTGGKKIVHLGDLGETLNKEQVKAIGEPDILLIPVGGYYTIDHNDADEVIKKLRPKLVIPMHFKTKASEALPIETAKKFLKNKEYHEANMSMFTIDFKQKYKYTSYILLDYTY